MQDNLAVIQEPQLQVLETDYVTDMLASLLSLPLRLYSSLLSPISCLSFSYLYILLPLSLTWLAKPAFPLHPPPTLYISNPLFSLRDSGTVAQWKYHCQDNLARVWIKRKSTVRLPAKKKV